MICNQIEILITQNAKKTQNKMKESSTERKNVREEEKWVKPSGWEDEEGRGGKE